MATRAVNRDSSREKDGEVSRSQESFSADKPPSGRLPRFQPKTFEARIKEFEREDRDRTDEILEILSGSGVDVEQHLEPETNELDWDAVRRESRIAGDRMDDIEKKYTAAPSLFRLSLVPEEEVRWRPGDYVSISLDETPGIEGEGFDIPETDEQLQQGRSFRPYSIASRPGRDAIDLYIQRIPDSEVDPGSSLTPVLEPKVEQQESITARGPYADELSLSGFPENDRVYIAAGTGMAPHMGMIDEALNGERDFDYDIWLFLGASFRDELPGHDRFQAWGQENDNFHYVPLTSREESLSESDAVEDWEGETGHVQDVIPGYDSEHGILEGSDIFVCGQPAMARDVREKLQELGVDTGSQRYREEMY